MQIPEATQITQAMTKKVTKKRAGGVNFEAALAELEALVARMEQGETSLEDSLKDFERGIELTRTCQTALAEAEQKVQILLQKDGDPTDFDNPDTPGNA